MELIDMIKNYEEEYHLFLKKLIEIESPTFEKKQVDKVIDVVEDFLMNENCKINRVYDDKFGDQLVAEWGKGDEQILFIGHVDTVWDVGTLKEFPYSMDAGELRGPGSYDMKSGIMQALFAIKTMNEMKIKLKHKIVLLINTDEEVGSPSSRKLIESEAIKSKFVMVGEGAVLPGGKLKIRRKGFGIFKMEIKGISSHAGVDPEKGVSAIHEFAQQVLTLEKISSPKKGITINVGVVKGGTRANVIADNLYAEIDLRAWTKQDLLESEKLINSLKPTKEGIELKISGGINRFPMEFDEKASNVFEQAKELASEIGIELEGVGVGGMSDANITSALGIPTIDGLGGVGGGGHSKNEHILVSYIPERIALMVKLFTGLK